MTNSHSSTILPHNLQQWQQLSALKSALRPHLLSCRQNLSRQQVEQDSHIICQRIEQQLPSEPTAIHLFLPMLKNHEVDLRSLLPTLWSRGDKLYVPRVTIDQQLEHVRLMPDTQIETNAWGIPEPAPQHSPATAQELQSVQMVITPLLVCDQQGYRVGYGGGFYDLFFQEYPHVEKIGVGLFEPIQKIIDTYDGDIPLNQYISPTTITRFKV